MKGRSHPSTPSITFLALHSTSLTVSGTLRYAESQLKYCMAILISAVLPIALVALVGVIIGRSFGLDLKTLLRVIYLRPIASTGIDGVNRNDADGEKCDRPLLFAEICIQIIGRRSNLLVKGL